MKRQSRRPQKGARRNPIDFSYPIALSPYPLVDTPSLGFDRPLQRSEAKLTLDGEALRKGL